MSKISTIMCVASFLGGGRSSHSVGKMLRVMDTIGIVGMMFVAAVLLCI